MPPKGSTWDRTKILHRYSMACVRCGSRCKVHTHDPTGQHMDWLVGILLCEPCHCEEHKRLSWYEGKLTHPTKKVPHDIKCIGEANNQDIGNKSIDRVHKHTQKHIDKQVWLKARSLAVIKGQPITKWVEDAIKEKIKMESK
jgi:hypothetical protein